MMMMDDSGSDDFDPAIAVALAYSTLDDGTVPPAGLRRRILEAVTAPALPAGFRIERASDDSWQPHPVPGIRMKVLSIDHTRLSATLLLDVAPGTRFPAHHHQGAEECYVISGSLDTCGRHLTAGDFVHADAGTDHTELRSDEGCRVLLVVPIEELLGHRSP
jgi:anti-sigma factor ChrR (cupin superfamily)